MCLPHALAVLSHRCSDWFVSRPRVCLTWLPVTIFNWFQNGPERGNLALYFVVELSTVNTRYTAATLRIIMKGGRFLARTYDSVKAEHSPSETFSEGSCFASLSASGRKGKIFTSCRIHQVGARHRKLGIWLTFINEHVYNDAVHYQEHYENNAKHHADESPTSPEKK